MSGGSSGAPRVAESEELALTAAEAKSFRRFWQLFRVARENRVLGVVIRRFSYAGERTRRDDEIVDLIATLEALLLSDTDNRAELGFRTALRGALFIEGSELTRREIKTQLGRGYRVRSAVAHGNDPSKRDLKAPNDDRITLDEFVDGIEELVRLAVRKAVEAVGAGASWPPDWDGLTLEGATYPSR
jgi:Apea-like HEPN